jgi:hypothetical protein
MTALVALTGWAQASLAKSATDTLSLYGETDPALRAEGNLVRNLAGPQGPTGENMAIPEGMPGAIADVRVLYNDTDPGLRPQGNMKSALVGPQGPTGDNFAIPEGVAGNVSNDVQLLSRDTDPGLRPQGNLGKAPL